MKLKTNSKNNKNCMNKSGLTETPIARAYQKPKMKLLKQSEGTRL